MGQGTSARAPGSSYSLEARLLASTQWIHLTLAEYLATKPDGIGNHDEAGKLLEERANINHEIYHAARTGSTSDASELAMLKRKGEMLEACGNVTRQRAGQFF